MKSLMCRLDLALALVSLAFVGLTTPILAQENRNPPADRLERLEQRVNELAERQEQLLRRMGAQMERQGPMAQPPDENFRRPMPPPGAPLAGPQNLPGAKFAKGIHDTLGLLFLIGIICNILLTIWIFTDIRKRGEGSRLFVAMALVAGIPAALIYALTRIGDKKA
jgi:HAMP domain-containing protein